MSKERAENPMQKQEGGNGEIDGLEMGSYEETLEEVREKTREEYLKKLVDTAKCDNGKEIMKLMLNDKPVPMELRQAYLDEASRDELADMVEFMSACRVIQASSYLNKDK